MKTLLFVDDEPHVLSGLRRSLLGRSGEWSLRFATDVGSAWALLRSEPIDLVVSDLDMPGESGLDLLARVRADEALRGLPFLILSGNALRERASQARAQGADAFLAKPCATAELVETLVGALS